MKPKQIINKPIEANHKIEVIHRIAKEELPKVLNSKEVQTKGITRITVKFIFLVKHMILDCSPGDQRANANTQSSRTYANNPNS